MKLVLVVVLVVITIASLTESVAVKRDVEGASPLTDVIQAVANQVAGHVVKRQADDPTPGPTPSFDPIIKAVAEAIAGHASKRNVDIASPIDVIRAAANQVAGHAVKREAGDVPGPVDSIVKLAAHNAFASGNVEKVLKGIPVDGGK